MFVQQRDVVTQCYAGRQAYTSDQGSLIVVRFQIRRNSEDLWTILCSAGVDPPSLYDSAEDLASQFSTCFIQKTETLRNRLNTLDVSTTNVAQLPMWDVPAPEFLPATEQVV